MIFKNIIKIILKNFIVDNLTFKKIFFQRNKENIYKYKFLLIIKKYTKYLYNYLDY